MKFGRATTAAASPPLAAPRARRWALGGTLIGGITAAIAFAPASWMARALADASQGRLLLAETSGSLWSGSGVLVLTGGADSRDASRLPGRLEWTLGLTGLALQVQARQACCINGSLNLRIEPGLGRWRLALLDNAAGWTARWPAAWMSGLGTPWNTLQLGGGVRMSSQGLQLEWAQGRWIQTGRLDLDFVNLASRVSPVAPLGSYRLTLAADPTSAGVSTLQMQTLDGALQISGQGTLSGGRARFNGSAQAAPGREAGLDNLLNIIGRRDGGRSLISIG